VIFLLLPWSTPREWLMAPVSISLYMHTWNSLFQDAYHVAVRLWTFDIFSLLLWSGINQCYVHSRLQSILPKNKKIGRCCLKSIIGGLGIFSWNWVF
jgi:hypothetical protein